MYKRSILAAIAALVLATIACSVSLNFPIDTDLKTGPTTVKEIHVPELDSKEEIAEISLIFGAGELSLSPGAEKALLEGTASYNVIDLKPVVEIDGNQVAISNGNLEINGIPNFSEKIENKWEFQLGSAPIDLTIKAGAYKGQYQLGKLNLTSLHITDGAADVDLDFRSPNQSIMRSLRYETGASNISLTNLVNANFETMIFQGGAGNYELDFSGELQDDAEVIIETGLSNVTITVPANTNTELKTEGGLSNINTRGAWRTAGSRYTIEGDDDNPTLTITVEMGAGNLNLHTVDNQ